MPDGQLNLEELLADLGFDSPEAHQAALALLREEGLVSRRPKTFISRDKKPRVREALQSRFLAHCADAECSRLGRERARTSGLAPVLAGRRAACQVCQGANNRRAFARARQACVENGITQWLIVGGSPNLRSDLAAYLAEAPELRIDVDEGRSGDSKSDRARARRVQAIAILSRSEINHKHTAVYTGEFKDKVILIPARGLEALFEGMERHARGAR